MRAPPAPGASPVVVGRRALAVALLLCGCDPGPPATDGVCTPEEAAALTAATRSSPRPLRHFTPPDGWMNDPAGLVWLDGEYHLSYQRDPHDVFVADVRWGHAVSPDLLHWEDLPDALVADPVLGVPFTGSAVVDRRGSLCPPDTSCLVAVFTHAFGEDGRQKQSVAWSADRGRSFTSYAGNPVIGPIDAADFRDPNVRWHAATSRWVMAVGTRDRVLFYTSPDLLAWTATGAFAPTGAPRGAWECPDLFPLEAPDGTTRWVLKVDVNPGLLQAGPSRYWVGDFDGATFTAATAPEGLRFDGPDLYAAQTFSNVPDGRTVWLGWTSAWSYAAATPTVGWRGAHSLPRTLSLVDTADGPRLAQAPVAELDDATASCALLARGEVPLDGAVALLDDAGEAYVLTATLDPGDATAVGFDVLAAGPERTRVGYDAVAGVLFVDRTASGDVGFAPGFGARHEVPVEVPAGGLDLIVHVDRTTVEVFAAGGLAVLTSAVYPSSATHGLAAFAEGGAGTAWDVRVRSALRTLRE